VPMPFSRKKKVDKESKNNKEITTTISANGPFETVPVEVITLILFYLNPPDLVRASEVSKLFYQLASQDILWRRFLQCDADPEKKADAKAFFIHYPQKILPQYANFSPILDKAQNARIFLDSIIQAEWDTGRSWSAHENSLVVRLLKQLEQALKPVKEYKIKGIRPYLFKTQYDRKQLLETLKLIHALPLKPYLALLEEIGTQKSRANPSYFSNIGPLEYTGFARSLIKLVDQYGLKAAVFEQSCLEKILNFLRTYPQNDHMRFLIEILMNPALIFNPALPQWMDTILDKLANRSKITAEAKKRFPELENVADRIVFDILQLQEASERAALVPGYKT